MADELKPGANVTPSVRLVRPLAEGGMGKLWVAEHLVLETRVAVKLMAKEVEGRADAAARFGREAAIAAAVKNPHVVQVFDSGVNDAGIAYIVMELLEGHDLGAHLAARGPMPTNDVATTAAGALTPNAFRCSTVPFVRPYQASTFAPSGRALGGTSRVVRSRRRAARQRSPARRATT